MNTPTGLFAPNNHSAWKINYRPVDEERAESLKAILRQHYFHYFDTIISLEQVDEAEVNSNNFKITTKKTATTVTYLLRRLPISRSRQDIERTCEIMSALLEKGIAVPHVLLSNKKEVLIETKEGWFLLFSFIGGDHYRGTWEELVDAGKKIGALDKELFLLTSQYTKDSSFHFSETYRKIREFSVPIWEDIFSKAFELSKKEGEGSFGLQLLAKREEILKAVKEQQETIPQAQTQLMHFDLHPHNTLADGKELLAVLDFDSLRYVEKMRAVSFALHRLVRQYIVHISPSDVSAEVKKAQKAFIEAYCLQNTLSKEEIKTIPYFIKNEALSRLTTAMKEYANTGNLVWKHDLTKQLSNISESSFFS